jgi:hypothetical protein
MTDEEGLSVRDIAEWCGGGITVRQITRLLRLADGHMGGQTEASGWAENGRTGRGVA